jgi:deoxyadenosine/deoxycytidine kinase
MGKGIVEINEMDVDSIMNIEEPNNVVIIGKPATGKTTFSEVLQDRFDTYSMYHTDDYIEHGYEQSLYALMSDIGNDDNPKKIIEGVQGYRLLRKWAQIGGPTPDIVVDVRAPWGDRLMRYSERGNNVSVDKIQSFDRNLEKVFHDFMQIAPAGFDIVTIDNPTIA